MEARYCRTLPSLVPKYASESSEFPVKPVILNFENPNPVQMGVSL